MKHGVATVKNKLKDIVCLGADANVECYSHFATARYREKSCLFYWLISFFKQKYGTKERIYRSVDT